MKKFSVFLCMILIALFAPTTATATLMADLTASPTFGVKPLAVSFDLDYSYVPSNADLDVVLYELDFEGDGVYDYSDATSGETTQIYPVAGIFEAVGRVTNAAGITAIDYELITVLESGPVPEPATLLLLGTGLVGLVGLRRKFRK